MTAPASHIVVTVHGIRAFGQWQERLKHLLERAEPGILVTNYTFGWFSLFAFLTPPLRWIATQRFRRELVGLVQNFPNAHIDLVGHSFGTHLIGWSIRRLRVGRSNIRTVILTGSVLRPTFPWGQLLRSNTIERVVNECAIYDGVLVLNQVFVLFTGVAGILGFKGLMGASFHNSWHRFGHSGYFRKDGRDYDDFMIERWVPLLTENVAPSRVDARPDTMAYRVWVFVLQNLELVRLAVYAVVLLALVMLPSTVKNASLISAFRLPPGISSASKLQSISIDTPIASLAWVPRSVTRLEIALREDGTPHDYPTWIKDLAISGHADSTKRYLVNADTLPRSLSSLTLDGVQLLKSELLQSFPALKSLSLNNVLVADRHAIDAGVFPVSLESLSLVGMNVGRPEFLTRTQLRSITTDTIDVFGHLPLSTTDIAFRTRALDSTTLSLLSRFIKMKNLSIESSQSGAYLDLNWLAQDLDSLSLRGVALVHAERLTAMRTLRRLSIDDVQGTDFTGLPVGVLELSTTGCMDNSELAVLPRGLGALSIGCVSELSKTFEMLKRFQSLRRFAVLCTSDILDFEDMSELPRSITELAIAPSMVDNIDALGKMKLTELDLDVRAGACGSDMAREVTRNVIEIDASELPPSLERLSVSHLPLSNPKRLAALIGLTELTVDGLNRATIGLPRSLKKLVIKEEVGPRELEEIFGFRTMIPK